MAQFIATRMYLTPLLPANPLRGVDIQVSLRRAKRDLLRRVRAQLLQTTFSIKAKKALAKAIEVRLKPSSIQVISKHPAFAPLVRGQKKGQMKWLTKARAPIPIITENGELIFRSATAKSMANGRWVHPGRKPSDFIEKAKKESREFMRARLAAELKQQLRMAWSRTR